MTHLTLRELARGYFTGEIHKDAYRKKRAELISGILAGEIILRENTYPDIILPKSFEELDTTEPKSDRKQPSQPQTPPAPQVTAPPTTGLPRPLPVPLPWVIAAGGLLVLSLALIVFFNLGPDEEENPVSPRIVTPTTPTPTPAVGSHQNPTTTVNNLLQSFMTKNDWSEQGINGLRAAWSDLPETDRETATNSVILDQMTNAIHRQLLEERALIGLRDDASVIFKQQLLIALAGDLGINDPRMIIETPATKIQPPENPPTDTASPASSIADTVQPSVATGETTMDETPTAILPTPDESSATEPAPIVAATADVTPNNLTEAAETSPSKPDAQTVTPEPEVEVAKVVPPSAAEEPTVAERQSGGSACKPSLVNSRRPYCREKLSEGLGDGPTMVAIPAGRFLMGGSEAAEKPAHEVTIAKAFAMSVHEVTYGEYQQFCKNAGKTCPVQPWTGKDYPVVNVTWSDAVAYADWLSEKTGRTYRLPSEAEWEYAARGGTTTIYPFGDEIDFSFAVFSYRSKLNSPLPKTDRSINRNPFRLYHIIGNVREWVADNWNDSYAGAPQSAMSRTDGDASRRVIRGGSYNDPAEELRSGARVSLPVNSADRYTGFRVIQEM
jgi:formylglycine-generating enzyme required for sulfatase activity